MRSAWVAVLSTIGCGAPPAGTQVAMDFARTGGLYDAPFPSDDLRRADGTIDLGRFPNPDSIGLIEQALGMLDGTQGFAESGGVFFQLTGPLAPTGLPDLADSVSPSSPVF